MADSDVDDSLMEVLDNEEQEDPNAKEINGKELPAASLQSTKHNSIELLRSLLHYRSQSVDTRLPRNGQ